MEVQVLEKTPHWWRVKIAGQEGWALPEYLKPMSSLPDPIKVMSC